MKFSGLGMNMVELFRQFPVEDLLYFLTIFLFFVSLAISASVKSRFRRYAKEPAKSGMTGMQAAERILRANGIYDVEIREVSGTLTDNYNPVNRTLNLSQPVCSSSSVSAIAVAAHECGHAIQHAEKYSLLMLRKAMVPVCNIGSIGSYAAILLGLFFAKQQWIEIGAILFGAIVLFNFITLPVEINASRRALSQIENLNLLNEDELQGVRKVLAAAAMTYFIALVSSLVQFARLLAIANRRN